MSSEEPGERFPLPAAWDSKPFLTLVDRAMISNMGNIPRRIWEPMSLLYDEADKAIARVVDADVPEELEHLKPVILEKWGRVLGWLDEILLKSQSVDALRSKQMVEALRAPTQESRSPLVGMVPESPRKEGRKRGLRGR